MDLPVRDVYVGEHIRRLQDSRGDSILSDVIRDSDLTDVELKMLAALLFGAGFITTTHILGKAVIALVRHPDQLAALRANPDGWPNAVEEILRYDAPVQFVPRVAAEDVEIEGYSIRAGEAIFIMYGGANRDPAVFDDPNTFDTARANAREHGRTNLRSHWVRLSSFARPTERETAQARTGRRNIAIRGRRAPLRTP